MPRKARVESSTGVYHMMVRGNNKEWVFKGERFKRLYLDRMNEVIKPTSIEVHAWCIMDNHVHIVAKGELQEISLAMKSINGYFAQKHNLYKQRIGHVLQDRFRSEVVEADGYFKGVIRYVHQNPVKAKMVQHCKDYQWSSYKAYLSGEMNHHSINILQAYFNDNLDQFQQYHDEVDDHEYLDTKDTIKKLRLEKAQKIIQSYCHRYQITSIYALHQNQDIRNQMIYEIGAKSQLPLPKIGQLCGVSYSTVYEIMNRAK